LTPDNEVYVEEPVKFIATKEEIAVITKNHDIFSKIVPPVRPNDKRIRKSMTLCKTLLRKKIWLEDKGEALV